MRRIYLSFLGLGQYDKESATYFYQKTTYELNGEESKETPFVQAAEIELLGGDRFDVVLIVATQKSYDMHFEKLAAQLRELGVSPIHLIIDEEMGPADQWRWFESIMDYIEHGDALTVDLTHGYRSVPIIFSAAINFLQKARNISLDAVYYGAFDKNRKLAPIIDMKDFYLINEWADAVGRLVDDADARKLADVADKSPGFQAGDLNDKTVIRSFDELTDTIRNVDINNVASKANDAIQLIQNKEKNASRTGKLLLGLVIDKFVHLTTREPPTGKYDADYFKVQIEIMRLLMEHKLFMQAYTVMREFIVSIGMIQVPKAKVSNKKGRNLRYRFGELFLSMVQFERDEWLFDGKRKEDSAELLDYYDRLEAHGVMGELKNFARELVDYRNGFDHCWTLKSGAFDEIEKKGNMYLGRLEQVVDDLIRHGFLTQAEQAVSRK